MAGSKGFIELYKINLCYIRLICCAMKNKAKPLELPGQSLCRQVHTYYCIGFLHQYCEVNIIICFLIKKAKA